MTARRHYIHTQDGFRLRGSDVFVEVREVGGATSVKTGDEILLSELSARDVISFYVVIDGVEISLPIDLDSCSGNKGMRDPDVSFLDRVADVHGGAVAEKLALMLIDALPGVVKEENVGESEEWAKTALLSCARYVKGGLIGVLHERPDAVELFESSVEPIGDLVENRALRAARNINPGLSVVYDLYSSQSTGSLIKAVLSGGELARYALYARGHHLPEEILIELALTERDERLRSASIRALARSGSDSSIRISTEVLLRALSGAEHIGDRLAESAILSADLMLVRKIAVNTKAPWMWCCAALSRLLEREQGVFEQAASDSRSHPLVRVAATSKIKNSETLERLSQDKNPAVSECAMRVLGRDIAIKRPETTLRTREVMSGSPGAIRLAAIDIDGTMLDDAGKVVKANISSVRSFTDSGGVVCFTTTRTMEDAMPVARESLGERDGVLICDEGVTVCDVQTGLPLRHSGLLSADGEMRSESVVTGETMLESARRLVNSNTAGVEIKRGDDGRVVMYQARDKAGTLDYVTSVMGVSLSECVAIGDGRVDVPMFEKVTNGGGISVAVANAQPGVIDHQSVGVVSISNVEGGVGCALDMIMSGDLPPVISDRELGLERGYKREVFSQYAVCDGGEIRNKLSGLGLGHLVQGGLGVKHYGGTICSPGHVTFAHPNDWRGKPMPRIKNDDVWVIGWVDDLAVSALVCAVGGSERSMSIRPDGSIFHITLRTKMGLAPVVTNEVIKNGWIPLDTPFKINTVAIESSKIR
jgi:hydroxymethylpyrimidine pyrophosphatase-like HAD family hydrolase